MDEIKETPPEEEVKEDYKDKYLRLLAEIDNTRKRLQKEKQEMTRFAVENALEELLEPIDNMENALKFVETMSEEVRNWAMGFQMILGQFKEALHTNGITPFTSEGMRFDPSRHHAIETEETETIPEGTILKEFVKGYVSKERTVRPARVKVAVAPSADLNETKKENNHV